tara:strand:+ start:1346 stop:1516 length:171 start_codon:yes stop_codon:yes gene_type:complete
LDRRYILKEQERIQTLDGGEIDSVSGGSEIPPPAGIWDIIPGWKPPWWEFDPPSDT